MRRGHLVGAHDGADGRDGAWRAMGRARHSLSDAARTGRVHRSLRSIVERCAEGAQCHTPHAGHSAVVTEVLFAPVEDSRTTYELTYHLGGDLA